MIKMLDFTKADYVDEKSIAINDQWLDGILDGYKEEDVNHIVLQMNGNGKSELSIYWEDGDCTMYRDCGGVWAAGVHFI